MICVVGLGYIGLPTAIMLAASGNDVVGYDIDKDRVKALNEKKLLLDENEFEEEFNLAYDKGIKFVEELPTTDLYIVSVPTPYNHESMKIDPKILIDAVKNVLGVCRKNSILVIESTISPGTIDTYIRPLLGNNENEVSLVHAPERIIPGNMIYELKNNNRTIGADNEKIGEYVQNIYSTFCKGEIVLTDIRTAEMTKVIENTYRAINIAFANELAKLCYKHSMNVNEIIDICNKHPRVNILSPGPGVGGHCIAVDPRFLIGDYPRDTDLIRTAMEINDSMPEFVLNRIYKIMKDNNIKDISRVGLYGLTYKENIDDCRQSPTLQLLEIQREHLGEPLKVYDPYVKKDIVENQYHDFDKFLDDIDIMVVMVNHKHLYENLKIIGNKIIYNTKADFIR